MTEYQSPFRQHGHAGPCLDMNVDTAREKRRETMHPGKPRDVDLAEWLNAAAFHPADTQLKQLGHEAARRLIGELGQTLWQLLPPSREKSIVFTHLEQARHYANQALAVHGGPGEHVTVADIESIFARTERVELPADPRVDIEAYKASQLVDLPFPMPQVVADQVPGDPAADRPATSA
jgi:hypothetical protein